MGVANWLRNDAGSSMKPRHALTHPLWLGALALLVLNDHALKGAGLLPGWLTGKLSDVAGMLVAPLLLAVIAQVSSRHGWALAHVAVGVVFAAIKLSDTAAQAFETLTALTPFPWVIVVDPSDLLALPALAADESAVVQYGREFFRTHRVSRGAFQAGLEQFGRQGVVELSLILGNYSLLALLINAFDTDLPPDRTEPLLPV